MQINLEDFMGEISHAPDNAGVSETTGVQAIKLDEQDGVSVALGFTNNMLNKADYIYLEDNKFIIIEASDLRNQSEFYFSSLKEKTEKLIEENDGKKLPRKISKNIEKECFYPIRAELSQKWSGSIATIERLCRRNRLDIEPNYTYLVICKNDTEERIMDLIKQKMQGTIKNIDIIKTDDINEVFRNDS
ncbi:hypothetical protein [Photobacterium leiognathi]|uniref:hypothetical protein n=1 Tax=Photobacterium leiognathi TaxID=553611 RepID=UPI002982771B|nr:hypothetical protein [Photobacterium leiognathi]